MRYDILTRKITCEIAMQSVIRKKQNVSLAVCSYVHASLQKQSLVFTYTLRVCITFIVRFKNEFYTWMLKMYFKACFLNLKAVENDFAQLCMELDIQSIKNKQIIRIVLIKTETTL